VNKLAERVRLDKKPRYQLYNNTIIPEVLQRTRFSTSIMPSCGNLNAFRHNGTLPIVEPNCLSAMGRVNIWIDKPVKVLARYTARRSPY
jgi:hypothetical protein